MKPQDLGASRVSNAQNEALESHCRRLSEIPYQWQITSSSVRSRNTQVSLTSESGRARHQAVPRPTNIDRRLKCQRALNCWQHSALLQPYQPAQAVKQTKNTLWLHLSPSQLSQLTLVSTIKTTRGSKGGQASAPVLTFSRPCTLTVGGASC